MVSGHRVKLAVSNIFSPLCGSVGFALIATLAMPDIMPIPMPESRHCTMNPRRSVVGVWWSTVDFSIFATGIMATGPYHGLSVNSSLLDAVGSGPELVFTTVLPL